MKVIFIFLLGLTVCNAQLNKSDCEELNQGFFIAYENETIIGYFLRKDGIQIEKAINDTLLSIAKFKSNNCIFYLNSFEIENEIDTISWTVEYIKEKDFIYSYIMKPTYLDNKILFKGKTVKIDSLFDKYTFDLMHSGANPSNKYRSQTGKSLTTEQLKSIDKLIREQQTHRNGGWGILILVISYLLFNSPREIS